MSKARITIELSEDGGPSGSEDMYLNEKGRALLIERLQSLSEKNDHFHLFASEWGGPGDPLRLKPYMENAATAGALKVSYRTDKVDEEYFPHLLYEQED